MRRSVRLLFRGVVRHAFFQMRKKLVFDFAGGGGGRGGKTRKGKRKVRERVIRGGMDAYDA